MSPDISDDEIDDYYDKIKAHAEEGGYFLNPDTEYAKDLVRGLLVNRGRYGYESCPCRLAAGEKEEDIDMICPCDYRDPDIGEFGACFCALYVSEDIAKGERSAEPIPERRPPREERSQFKRPGDGTAGTVNLPYPVWRCKVCGYLAARDNPPPICPVCKAKADRFERFM